MERKLSLRLVDYAGYFNGLRRVKFLALFILCTLVAYSNGAQADIPGTVGEVSMVLGKAYLHSPDKSPMEVTNGLSVKVSDKVVTGTNGHVHIRFIDDALVSVRPGSRLEIVSYEFQPENPESSTIKFNLIEGVTRSISGQGAKAARSRFRLNTPIAAIGVRGTDFVVSASDETVRALVNEGTIVLAPYSDGCSADTFGPCSTSNAVELRGQTYQMLELSSSQSLPLLTSQDGQQASLQEQTNFAGIEASSVVQPEAEDQVSDSDAFLEARTVAVAADLADSNGLTTEIDRYANLPDFSPPTAVDQGVLAENQLMWGRFAWGTGSIQEERITVPYDVAREGRAVTVSNIDYALFRVEDGTKLVDKGLGIIGFALSSAQAFYYSESGVVAMHVNGGKLDIDFDQRLFETQLDLSHNATGIVDFRASGKINNSGYFFSNSEQQRIAGSTSLDGSQAGYFFEQQLQKGGIQGLTLWDSK